MTVDTKMVERRDVAFRCFGSIREDLDRIQSAQDAGTLRTTGNWSAGQVLWHCGKFMQCALDGFPNTAPAPVRWMASLMFKKKAVKEGEPFPAGFKLPKQASFLIPDASTTYEEGMRYLREQVSRVEGGEKFTAMSPLLGTLTHDEWEILQRKHCMLHLSFVHLE